MVVGNRTQRTLRVLREQAGISQRKLAATAGVDRAQLGRIESGTQTLSSGVAEKSARVLGVDAVELMISHNFAAIKGRVEAGEEGPTRALNLARMLVRMLEEGALGPKHRILAKRSASELLSLVEGHMPTGERTVEVAAKSAGGGAGRQTINEVLGRDGLGKPRRGGSGSEAATKSAGGPQLGQDDNEWDAPGPRVDQSRLGRDTFGRVV